MGAGSGSIRGHTVVCQRVQDLPRQQPAAAPGALDLAAVEPVAAQSHREVRIPDVALLERRLGDGVAPAVCSNCQRRRAAEFGEGTQQLSGDRLSVLLQIRLAPIAARVQQPGLRAGPRQASSAAARLGKAYLARVRELPFFKQRLDRSNRPGSNQWAVSGRHTASGRPLVANDPHLALDAPSTFYPVHLTTGDTDVIGSGFAGVPFVIVGHNRYIAWGATVSPLDVTDGFLEQVVPDATSPSGLATVYMGRKEWVVPIPERYRINLVGDSRTGQRGAGAAEPFDPGGHVDRAAAEQRPDRADRPRR